MLTNYGDVYYMFFDGAFSVGPDGRRQEYDWDGFVEVVRRCQPNAVIFSDGGPDVRWVGNERGYASETNWSTVRRGAFYPGIGGVSGQLLTGHEDGDMWCPTEVNTSIRPGWFYHAEEDDKVKPLSRLVDNWFHSVGMNGNFLLNLPPDRRGLIHENDVRRLVELKNWLDEAFSLNYAEGASIIATNTRGKAFNAAKAADGDENTFWAAEDHILAAALELDFGEAVAVNAVSLQEYIRLGQRVKSFSVEADVDGAFVQVASGITVGSRRIVRFDPVETQRLRIKIEAKACPVISEVSVYKVPVIGEKDGLV